MFAFADPNASTGQIGFISTFDQTVSSLTLTAGSCYTCQPNPSGAPELGFNSVSFDPYTDVLVAYDPSTNPATPSFPGNAISLINPGTTTASGGYSAAYRIIAAIPTGQVGSGTYTPTGQTTPVTVNGPMIYDPKSKFVLVGNAGSNTLSYLNLDPSNQFKPIHIDTLQVIPAPGSQQILPGPSPVANRRSVAQPPPLVIQSTPTILACRKRCNSTRPPHCVFSVGASFLVGPDRPILLCGSTAVPMV